MNKCVRGRERRKRVRTIDFPPREKRYAADSTHIPEMKDILDRLAVVHCAYTQTAVTLRGWGTW